MREISVNEFCVGPEKQVMGVTFTDNLLIDSSSIENLRINPENSFHKYICGQWLLQLKRNNLHSYPLEIGLVITDKLPSSVCHSPKNAICSKIHM